ncbi:ABC transporter permease [Thalassolituus hydrocarboniclasticus]|uniref:ABC transporter permease n=1 Tax=Thalassolituus hydrocarboniclasticus TaxID=2742796 RepID=A0ABY6ACN7_9GAMM|nr:FtsX-like permease family protein [Thalassolituus hydrocarboniclasticus]UXD88801.1 ABC transporter permease [Thalassolituus hydrocarboniclasticus]
MTLYRQWLLALRLLLREARSGELTLILAALLIAVTSTTAIALFSARLDLAMQSRSNDLLGADLRLQSTSQIDPAWQEEAQRLGLSTSQTLTFPSVVLHGDDMSLAAIKAVDKGYPLRGILRIREQAGDDAATLDATQGPLPGEAWVEPRLLALLNAQLGDEVELGTTRLRLSAVIVEESDRGGNFYNLSPRLMMNWADLESSGLTAAGSRLNWRLLLLGDEQALTQLRTFRDLAPNQKFESLADSNQAMANALDKARRYLGLAAMLAVVLASVAVAISAQRYASRHFDISALMRTFGLARAQVWNIYALQLLQLGLVATLAGLALAAGLQAGLLAVLGELVPQPLPAAPWSAWLLGASSGLLTLLGFALPYLLPLARVTPLRVLRRDLQPVPLSGWLITSLALIALTLLLFLFTHDLPMTLGMMGGGSLLVVIMLLALNGLIQYLRRLLAQRDLPLMWRFAWQHLSRNSRQSAGQILAFALTMMVMLVIGALRNDLLADWQASLPDDAPNVFAINIQPYEVDEFRQSLQDAGLQSQKLYPMVPGRLLRINDVSVQELAVADDPAINRDLALTSDQQLPASNAIEEGSWQRLLDESGQVSLEQRLAGRLGVGLGDTLSFSAGGVEFSAVVSSIRSVDWGTMTPNFYMMFSADVLAQLPANYLTSFYVPPASQAKLTALIRQYPGITLLDMQVVLGQVQALLSQVSLAVELILLFVLVAALLVMLSSLVAALPERLREGAVLRTLGAGTALLRRGHLAEFALLGFISSLLALIGAEAICFGLYRGLLSLPYDGLGWVWLWLPPLAALLLALPGMWLMRRTVTVAPLRVLRELVE